METFLIFLLLANIDKSINIIKSTKPKVISKPISVALKKKNFYNLVLPAIENVHHELQTKYNEVIKDINNTNARDKIESLKKDYNITTDEELLAILKPHPKSITLAQAAMESAWGTSRFFKEANNIFGMWSVNKSEARIPAKELRDGKKTIWLKKFNTIEDSIRAYYKLIATAKAYKEFRELRIKTDNPHELVKKLNNYSERGESYCKELSKMISYNHMVDYDKK